MTGQDFCYWLQGWIEISNPTEISEKQFLIIKKHLQLYKKYKTLNKEGFTRIDMFCSWLEGVFDSITYENFNLDLICNKLSDVFIHEIDLSYTDDNSIQIEMNNIHLDEPNGSNETIFRC